MSLAYLLNMRKIGLLMLFDPQSNLYDLETPFAHFGSVDQAIFFDQ